MRDPEHEALADAYCAWLNEAVRLRKLITEKGWELPFTLENMWRWPAAQSEGDPRG